MPIFGPITGFIAGELAGQLLLKINPEAPTWQVRMVKGSVHAAVGEAVAIMATIGTGGLNGGLDILTTAISAALHAVLPDDTAQAVLEGLVAIATFDGPPSGLRYEP